MSGSMPEHIVCCLSDGCYNLYCGACGYGERTPVTSRKELYDTPDRFTAEHAGCVPQLSRQRTFERLIDATRRARERWGAGWQRQLGGRAKLNRARACAVISSIGDLDSVDAWGELESVLVEFEERIDGEEA